MYLWVSVLLASARNTEVRSFQSTSGNFGFQEKIIVIFLSMKNDYLFWSLVIRGILFCENQQPYDISNGIYEFSSFQSSATRNSGFQE